MTKIPIEHKQGIQILKAKSLKH